MTAYLYLCGPSLARGRKTRRTKYWQHMVRLLIYPKLIATGYSEWFAGPAIITA
jgi:hypothetical protein